MASGLAKVTSDFSWVAGGLTVFIGIHDRDKDNVILDKRRVIESFIDDIIEPLRQVYGFKKETVRILHDPSCQHLSAFNRSGEIYLNLATFERENFAQGYLDSRTTGLLSFYFTLAHELTVSTIFINLFSSGH